MMEFHVSIKSGRRTHAFTFVEILVALSVLALVSASGLVAITLLNREAALHRIYTAAQTVAISQIELCLADTPFNPQLGQVPSELAIGTHTITETPLYADPNSDEVMVVGTVTTTVADAGLTAGGTNLNARTIAVTVTYQYRGRNYSVKMNTIRCSDV